MLCIHLHIDKCSKYMYVIGTTHNIYTTSLIINKHMRLNVKFALHNDGC